MNLEIIDFESVENKDLFPEHIIELLKEDNSLIFEVNENNRLLALAVLFSEGDGTYIINHLVNFDDDYDALEMLFMGIEDYCSKNYSHSLAVRLIDEKEILLGLMKPLGLAGFVPVNTGELLEYRLEDLKKTKFYKKIKSEDPEKIFKHVLPYKKLDKARKNSFYTQRKSVFSYIKDRNWDKRFSAFYVLKENVMGAIVADCASSKSIILEEVFALHINESKYVLPILLGAFLMEICKENDQDAKICFPLYEESIYQWILNVLGTPLVNKHIFEYAKII